MGKIKLGINGFGRIGRSAFKIAYERGDVEVIAINDSTNVDALAYLLKYDSNYGVYHRDVAVSEGDLIIDGKPVKVINEPNPANIGWGNLGVDVVLESSERFVSRDEATQHLSGIAKKVVIAWPNNDDGVSTIVLGANEDGLSGGNAIISNASATTNALGAVLSVLDDEFGVQKSLITSIHSNTSSQSLVDLPNIHNFREGRAAAENIIPSTTSAPDVLAHTLPQLAGKVDGLSIKVPVSAVSLADLTVVLGRPTSVSEVNDVIIKASEQPYYQGIIGINNQPLVSRDFIGNSHSGIVDLNLTKVVDGNLAKIMVWYDNEWGYCNRLVELLVDSARNSNN